MADRWFYVHGETRHGPYSGCELAGLAASGDILPTDMVWKEGIDRGVLARKVKHLFAADTAPASAGAAPPPVPPLPNASVSPSANVPLLVAADLRPAAASALPGEQVANPPAPAKPPEPIPDNIGLLPDSNAPATPAPEPPKAPPKHVRKGRAIVLKGALIVGQDGTNVKFKKKCSTCGQEDATRNTLKIANGVTRLNYYCPKCRKKREVEIQGYLN